MNENDLRKIDLNLLTIFLSVYEHGHVTRAADALGLTQPAVSHALTRLRSLFSDQLFIRVKSRIVPTPLAHEISVPIGEILSTVLDLVVGDTIFDPATATRTIRIGMLDYGLAYFSRRITRLLESEAPALTIDFRHSQPMAALEMIEDAELDIAIGPFTNVRGAFLKSTLEHASCVLVVRRDHPSLRRKPTLKRFCELGHVRFADLVDVDHQIDRQLARHGLQRRTVMVMPSYSSALFAVSSSDHLTVIPRRPAELYKEFLGLRLLELPLQVSSSEISVVCHQRSAGDSLIDWLWKRIPAIWNGEAT